MHPKRKRKLGASLKISYWRDTIPGGGGEANLRTEDQLIFPPIDMGRGRAESARKELVAYLNDDRISEVKIRSSKVTTVYGTLGVIFGLASLVLSLFLGAWSDPLQKKPKSKKGPGSGYMMGKRKE